MLAEIKNFNKNELKESETIVTNSEGVRFAERMNDDGNFEKVVQTGKINTGNPTLFHGYLYQPSEGKEWALPKILTYTDLQARPGYQTMNASEYQDEDDVLLEKVKVLASLIKVAGANFCVYSGAGISTAAGIADYASSANSVVINSNTNEGHTDANQATAKMFSNFDIQPTFSHFALTSLFNSGHLKHWIQQNHDGLPQKAFFPQAHLNEIHGAWYSPANPVIMMSGNLRGDLFDWLLEWEEKASLCLAVGTSLAGMNADRVFTSTCKRAKKAGKGLQSGGGIIINLQQTQYDNLCCLRIFQKIDVVMTLLLKELEVPLPEITPIYRIPVLTFTAEQMLEEDVFVLTHYDEEGNKSATCRKMIWDLREDAKVQITGGQYKGLKGEIVGKRKEGHYKVRIMHPLKGTFMAPKEHTLGSWWVECAILGSTTDIPLINCDESLRFL